MSLCQVYSASPVQGSLVLDPSAVVSQSCFPFMVLSLSLARKGQYIPHPGGHSLTRLLTAEDLVGQRCSQPHLPSPAFPDPRSQGTVPGFPSLHLKPPHPPTETVSLAESLIQLKPKQLKTDAGLADYQRELARPPQTQDWVHGPTLCHSYFPVQYRRDWPLGRRESSALGLRDQGMNFWASLEFSHHGPLRPAAAMP